MFNGKELKELVFGGLLKIDLAEIDDSVGVLGDNNVASEVDFLLREYSKGVRGHGCATDKELV